MRGKPVAVHYDFTLRKVTAHPLGLSLHKNWAWGYFSEFHTIVARCGQQVHAVDLDDGEAMALAIAAVREWCLATDDVAARKTASQLGVTV